MQGILSLSIFLMSITEPVHEQIPFSSEEKLLLNSPILQRLQWVGQLTGIKQVYPGGVHTRFIHSTGAMHIAGMYMVEMFSKFKGNVEDIFGKSSIYFIQVARIAALCHDIAHGPFSHSFDRSVYSRIYGVPDNGHDIHRFQLIESNLLKGYIEGCGITTNDVANVWKSTKDDLKNPKTAMYHIIHCITQGPLGADRIDFTKRDAYFTGSKQFGTLADKRIISQASIQFVNGVYCLCYNRECVSDIIQTLDGRKYMYNNVYFHQKSMASCLLIETMMEQCTKDLNLIERVKDPNQFRYINDYTLIGEIMALPNDHISKLNCKRFMDRDLPRLVKEITYIPVESTLANITDLPENAVLIKTRSLCGMNAEQFEDYHIYFVDTKMTNFVDKESASAASATTNQRSPKRLSNDKTFVTATKMLNDMNYSTQLPYYIARWYVF